MRRALLVIVLAAGCTASGESASNTPPREDAATTCGGFAQGASCAKPGTELATCPCADGKRVVCCDETGTAQVSMCTQLPIRCSTPDAGEEDAATDATDGD